MKSMIKNSGLKRRISIVLILSMIFTMSATDLHLWYGTVSVSKHASAATGEVDDTKLLDSNVVPDATLLTYLKSKVKEVLPSVDETLITVQNLAQRVTGTLTIPSGVTNVTGLGWARSASMIDLSSCSSVKVIDNNEFYNCAMSTVKLPSSVKTIGNSAFDSCSKLETINLGSVDSIGASAFVSCTSLKDASVDSMKSSLTYLGSGAFSGCKALTQAKVPSISDASLQHSVPTKLFSNCEALTKVTFCDSSLNKIQDYAFEGTGALTFSTSGSFGNKVPAGVSLVGEGAFMNSKIESLDLSNATISEIKKNTFYKANLATRFVFPNGVKSIGEEAFANSQIKKVLMPNTITQLEEKCFQYTSGMSELSLSKNLTILPSSSFMGAGSSNVVSGSLVFTGEASYNLEVSFTDATPAQSSLVEIGPSAFNCAAIWDDSFLAELTKLETIGSAAFSYTYFTEVNVPASVSSLGEKAFMACSMLKEVTFQQGSKVTDLPDNCFGNQNKPVVANGNIMFYSCIDLQKVTLPDKLERIGKYCFGNCFALNTVGCPSLMEEGVVNFPSTLKTIDEHAFDSASSYDTSEYSGKTKYNISPTLVIEIPDGGITKVVVPDSVEVIGEGAFQKNITLNELKIGSGVKVIPDNMCNGCGAYPTKEDEAARYNVSTDEYNPITFIGLKKLSLSDNVEKISDMAFYNCFALQSSGTKWNLPVNLKTIGYRSFYGCKSLDNVSFNSNLTSIGDSAFADASQMVTLTGTNTKGVSYSYVKEFCGLSSFDFTYAINLESIGTSAFQNTYISTISFPSKVTVIPDSVCAGCYRLKSVTGMSENVKKIGANAFYNCYELDSVKIPFSAEWNKTIFAGCTANNNKQLALLPTKDTENANIIKDRSTELSMSCFKNFSPSSITLAITDADKDENDPNNNLITYDNNDYIKVDEATAKISMYGKKFGQTAIKVSGKVDLYKAEANMEQVVLSISQKYNINVTTLPIDSLEIDAPSMTKVAGSNVKYMSLENYSGDSFTAKYAPVDTTEVITWNTDNTSILSIAQPTESQGKSQVYVKPLALGDAVVHVGTATKTEQCLVKVRIPCNNVTISSNRVTLAPGTQYQLDSTLTFDETKYGSISKDMRETCKYISNNEEVVKVDYDTGKIVAIANGTATVSAICQASNRAANCEITVRDAQKIDSITLTSSNVVTENGKKVVYLDATQLYPASVTASFTPETTTDNIVWSVENSSVAQVVLESPSMYGGSSSTNILPKKLGETVLHAKSGSLDVSCIVRVRVPAYTLALPSSSETIATGKTYQIKPRIEYPKEHVAKAKLFPEVCTYTSSDESIATVSSTGKVTGKKNGNVVITVKGMVSNRTATLSLSVQKGYVPPVQSIKLSRTDTTMIVGKKLTLKATIVPSDASKSLKWTTDNKQIATVSNGVVTAKTAGTVTITATGANYSSAVCKIKIMSPSKGLKIKATTGNVKKIYVAKGTSATLGRYFTNADCTDTFVYKAKKNKYGTVDTSGTITGKKAGKFKVTMTAYNGKKKTASASITVYITKKPLNAKKVKITGKKTLKVGKRICLTAKLTSSKATENVVWTCSNYAVANVDAYGVVTAYKKGKIKITAKTMSGKQKTFKITVKK